MAAVRLAAALALLLVAGDHPRTLFRRVLGLGIFAKQPSANDFEELLGQVARPHRAPRHLVTDQGTQFTSQSFRDWCTSKGIRQRFGAVGQPGAIAIIERFIRTLKQECVRALGVLPLARCALKLELDSFVDWYNSERPHSGLNGATPDERYRGRMPRCRRPRFEPRAAWPRASPCARPQTLVKGRPGARLEVSVHFPSHRRHLPRVTVHRVT
ncbi:MAG: integrase core domain-containing protein [Gemmataceae bacterium]